MKPPKPVDIIQQFVDQHAREDMLGFFDLRLAGEAAGTLAGLCKISRPTPGTSKLKYLSLTFTIDVPDEDARRRADEALTRLEGGALSATLPQVVEVVPVPSLDTTAESYVRQIDFLLEDPIDPGRFFVGERLLPAVAAVTRIQVGEVVWWDDATQTAPVSAAKDEPGSSVASRLASALKRFRS